MCNILVIGDSHTKVFKEIDSESINFDVITVVGATSQGINNPNSKTNSLNIFKKELDIRKNKRYDFVFLMLGEVDCGFTIWYYKEKYNKTLLQQFKRSIKGYESFISEVVLERFDSSQVSLIGCTPPTVIKTDIDLNSGNKRRHISVDILDRIRITNLYNRYLKNILTKKYNIYYFDINNHVTHSCGLVLDKYLNADKYDHHLNIKTTKSIWLKKVLDNITIF